LSPAQQDRAAQYLAQGLDFIDGDKPADAKKAFAEVLKVDRANPQAKSYYALCQSLLDHRRDPAASKQHYEAGLIAYAAGNPEEAVRQWQGAKRLDAGNLKAVVALAKVKKEIAQSEEIGL
jgi:tetratricopeptide (TPR) repeat protein